LGTGYGINGGAIGNNLGKTHWSVRNTQGSELGALPARPPTQAFFMGVADN